MIHGQLQYQDYTIRVVIDQLESIELFCYHGLRRRTPQRAPCLELPIDNQRLAQELARRVAAWSAS